MDLADRQTHLVLSAAFNLLYGAFNVTTALLLFIVFGGLGSLVTAIGVSTLALPAAVVGLVFVAVGVLGGMLVAAPFLVNILAAGLLLRAPDSVWTTATAVVAALLSLPVFPLGTALGVHTLVAVFWNKGATRAAASRPWPDEPAVWAR